MPARAFVGTSGWSYDHWRGSFYPEDLPPGDWLEFYRRRFDTVEVNNTFYRVPDVERLESWRDGVPEGFTFAVKANRYITHRKKLNDAHRTVPAFVERVGAMDDKLGPILFQLPPNWNYNGDRLRGFLHALPEGHRYTVEFRDRSWINEDACEALRNQGVAFCIHDFGGEGTPREVTADFVYARFHGPRGDYKGSYGAGLIRDWTRQVASWVGRGLDVYCYFNNDEGGNAPRDARELARALEAEAPVP